MKKNIVIALIATSLLLSSLMIAVEGSWNNPMYLGESGPRYFPSSTYVGDVYIYDNGTVSAPNAIGQVSGGYELLQDINGTIFDLMNNSALNGAGHIVNALGGYGIYLTDINGVTISDFNITLSNVAVKIMNASQITVADNVFYDSAYGIEAVFCSDLTISNNTNAGNSTLYFASITLSDYVEITDNTAYFASGTSYGVYATYCSDLAISNNTFYSPSNGMTVAYSLNVESTHNVVYGTQSTDSGIRVAYTSYFNSTHDSVLNSNYYAVVLSYVFKANIMYGDFNNSAKGSIFENINGLTITSSDFSNVSKRSACQISQVNNLSLSSSKFLQIISPDTTGILIGPATVSVMLHGLNISAYAGTGIRAVDTNNIHLMDSYIEAQTCVDLGGSTDGFTAVGNTLILECAGAGIQYNGPGISGFTARSNVIDPTFPIDLSIHRGIILSGDAISSVDISDNVFEDMNHAININSGIEGNISIRNNMINNTTTGIQLDSAYDSEIIGNVITNVTQNGILVGISSNLRVLGNSILNLTSKGLPSAIGIVFSSSGSSQSLISGNVISSNQASNTGGIQLGMSNSATVSANSISGTQFGILTVQNSYLNIYGNTIIGCFYGMYSIANNNFAIHDNMVQGGNYSFFSTADSSGKVNANTFENATDYVLYVAGASYVTFYHNNFINGAVVNGSIQSSIANFNLSSPIGGNYWSNYTGTGNNGFGTTPYVIGNGYVDYLPLTSRWITPTVTFEETGLAAGTVWTINLDGAVESSSTGSIVFYIDTALYRTVSYTIAPVPGYVIDQVTGSVDLNGTHKTVNVQFTEKTYNIVFTASGLPAGTSWAITLNGTRQISSESTITFTKINGSHDYAIEEVIGYHTTATGTVIVSGGDEQIFVSFEPNVYSIVIRETGLPAGEPWSFTIDGTQYNTTEPTIEVFITSGTYNVSASGPTGYKVSSEGSNITVNNASTSFAVTFEKKPALPFWVFLLIGGGAATTTVFIGSRLKTGYWPFMGKRP